MNWNLINVITLNIGSRAESKIKSNQILEFFPDSATVPVYLTVFEVRLLKTMLWDKENLRKKK